MNALQIVSFHLPANLRAVWLQIKVLQELVVCLLARFTVIAGLLCRILQLLKIIHELLAFLLGPAEMVQQLRLLLRHLLLEVFERQIDLLL